MEMATFIVDVAEIRARVGTVLNRLSAAVVAQTSVNSAGAAQLQAQVARLGQIAAGLAIIDAEALPCDGAGFGSTVTVKNLESGELEEYTLMVGSLVDLEANQVSLASPIGQALLGRMLGDEVTIATPNRNIRFRITGLVTLVDLLESHEISIASN
jgi:transcription elongation factor GreA